MLDPVARRVWTLERFGLTPRKVVARLRNRVEPRILCVSLPKAGTHLLERALCLHPRLYRRIVPTLHDDNIGRWNGLEALLGKLAPGQILVSHLEFRPEYREVLARHDVHCIFLIRNPRDLLVSQSFYIAAEKRHRLHQLFASQPDLKARLRLAISGDPACRLPSIGERLAHFAGWLQESDVVVRYEDLIGRGGGGEVGVQQATLRSIYQSLDFPQGDAFLRFLNEHLFSRVSPTFRRGTKGEWRQHFDGEIEQLFRSKAGGEADRYGYNLAPGT